jgi:hypothetical protein
MGLMVPIEHEVRVASPARAAALVRALGYTEVGVSALALPIDRLVGALAPGMNGSVHFEGTLNGFDELGALAVARGGYLDVWCDGTDLRIWPDAAWVHRLRLPEGGIDAVSAALGAKLSRGTTELGDTRVTINVAAAVALDVRMRAAAPAFALFRALAAPGPCRGHLTGFSAASLAALGPFLHAIGATPEASLTLGLPTAAALTTGECRWETEDLDIDWPEGKLYVHLLMPVRAADETAWRARIDAALAQASGSGSEPEA